MTLRILLTGGTGFVGHAVVAALQTCTDVDVRAAARNAESAASLRRLGVLDTVVVGELSGETDWARALEGIDAVIHLAGLAHLPDPRGAESRFDRVNRAASVALGAACLRAGVPRLVYVSSIKVNGEGTAAGAPYHPTEPSALPMPSEPYGRSKLLAERELLEMARASNDTFTVLCVRPPLVYGAGARANFAALVRAVSRGFPLPLGGIRNARSLVAVENLADFLVTAALRPEVSSGVLLVSDGHDLSTPELVMRIGNALGTPARLFALPRMVWSLCAAVGGRPAAVAQRLTGSLQVESASSHARLQWTPPLSVDEAFARAVRDAG